MDLESELEFGETVYQNNRQVFSIKLYTLSDEQLSKVLDTILLFAKSDYVSKNTEYKTSETTIEGARDFLTQLASEPSSWNVIGFYSKLFSFALNTPYIKFNGTGSRGFSIKVKIKDKGEISLCTLWNNGTINFSLLR